MYICPICNEKFETEELITKHSLRCWREHNPNYKSQPAPCKGNITKQEINFYIKHNLPLPTKHPNVRHSERFAKTNFTTMHLTHCDEC